MTLDGYLTDRRIEKAKFLDFGRTAPARRNRLSVRVFLQRLLHKVVQATYRRHTGSVSSGPPLIHYRAVLTKLFWVF